MLDHQLARTIDLKAAGTIFPLIAGNPPIHLRIIQLGKGHSG